MRAVICIPTFNERENIPSLCEEILDTVDSDILILDDDSPDGTGRVAEMLAKKHGRISVVHRERRQGIGPALIDGFQRAIAQGYDAIFQMDGDFSHQPRHLPALFSALETSDVSIGSRYVEGSRAPTWTLLRRGLSFAGNAYARGVFRMRERDLTTGYVGWRRHVLEAIDLGSIRSDSYAFQLELKYRAFRLGFTMVEVPIVFYDRVVGISKLEKEKLAEALLRVIDLRLRSAGS
jgi:dolichol-phosphate mannosyltransferase